MSAARAALRRGLKHIYRAIPGKPVLLRFLRGRLLAPQLTRHLHFRGPFTLKLALGELVHLHHDGDVVENQLYWYGIDGFEATSLTLWQALARDARGAIMDVGANSGIYALIAAAVQPDHRVIAFEPVARVAQRLRRHVAANGERIEVQQVALSDRSGTAMMHDSAAPETRGNVYSASLSDAFAFNTIQYPVETLRYDDWAAQPARIGLVKIDVERHEPAVIRGMMAMIRRDRPYLLVEILDEDLGGQVGALMDGLNYRYAQIVEGQGAVPSPLVQSAGGDDRNVFFYPAEQADAVRPYLEEVECRRG